jgi:hypothetical protein
MDTKRKITSNQEDKSELAITYISEIHTRQWVIIVPYHYYQLISLANVGVCLFDDRLGISFPQTLAKSTI